RRWPTSCATHRRVCATYALGSMTPSNLRSPTMALGYRLSAGLEWDLPRCVSAPSSLEECAASRRFPMGGPGCWHSFLCRRSTNPMSTEPLRIMIADDHPLFRNGMRALLDADPDTEVAGEATTGDEAIAMAADMQPDVILMDIQMPGVSGIEATRQ